MNLHPSQQVLWLVKLMQKVGQTQPATVMAFGNGQHTPAIVGKHIFYTYENNWRYELYFKNSQTLDYRIHSGLVAGRWVKDQRVSLVQLAGENRYKMDWTEPTGTSVSLAIDLGMRHLHGAIFFPQWVHRDPHKTVCFQNEHLDKMCAYRVAGPTYPIVVVSEFAKITYIEDCMENDESVINCPPADLPHGYATRCN